MKWWPALVVVLLLMGPWTVGEAVAHGSGRLSHPRRLAPAATAAAVWAAVQVPAIAISPANWWASTAMHLQRRANRDSLVGVVFESGVTLWPSSFWSGAVTRLLTVVTLGSLLVSVGYVARRLNRGTLGAGDAAVALFVLQAFRPLAVLRWMALAWMLATVLTGRSSSTSSWWRGSRRPYPWRAVVRQARADN